MKWASKKKRSHRPVFLYLKPKIALIFYADQKCLYILKTCIMSSETSKTIQTITEEELRFRLLVFFFYGIEYH